MLHVKTTKLIGLIVSLVMVLSCLSFMDRNAVEAMNTNVEYLRYDCETGTTTTYTLTSVPYQDVSRIAVSENRVEDPGNTAVVYLRNIGTAFIVGKNVIATAAHCVSNWNNQTFAASMQIDICQDNANQVIATFTPSSIHIPSRYFEYTDEEMRSCYDYALIYIDDTAFTTDDSQKLSKYGVFSLGVPLDGFLANNGDVYGTGFPGSTHGDVKNTNKVRYKSNGYIQFFENDYAPTIDLRFSASCCTSAGDSGGPLYTLTNSYNGEDFVTVIGIVTGGGYYIKNEGTEDEEIVYFGTSGVRMTTDLLHFYLNNSYL